jgi:hypothetical protein
MLVYLSFSLISSRLYLQYDDVPVEEKIRELSFIVFSDGVKFLC